MNKIFKTIMVLFTGVSLPMIAGGIIASVVTQTNKQKKSDEYTGFKFIRDAKGRKVLAVDTTGISGIQSVSIKGPFDNITDNGDGTYTFSAPGYYTAGVTYHGGNSGGQRVQVGGAYITEACGE